MTKLQISAGGGAPLTGAEFVRNSLGSKKSQPVAAPDQPTCINDRQVEERSRFRILLDVQMPRLDGLSVTRLIRAGQPGQPTRICRTPL